MGSVTTEQNRDFHRAAASFYRESPWRSMGEDETIQIDCAQLEGGPWFALVMGKASKLRGLILFEDEEGHELMRVADGDDVADRLRNLGVHFEDQGQVRPADLEAAKQHGFEVAGRHAYPHPFRMDYGRQFRAPSAWELELLEATLWLVPDFLKRAKDRTPEVFEYAFNGTIGRMNLDLCWVPRGRSRTG